MHSNVTIKNVSWPHFSWPTLYNCNEILRDVTRYHFLQPISQFING